MDNKIDPCDTMRVNLIAAAVGLQQCTKTESNIVPIPDGRVIAVGTPAEVRELLAADVDAPAAPAASSKFANAEHTAAPRVSEQDERAIIEAAACIFDFKAHKLPEEVKAKYVQFASIVRTAQALAQAAQTDKLEYRTCCDHPDCSTCAGRGGFYRIGAGGAAPHTEPNEHGLLPCPFCGSTNIDPAEWSGNDDKSGPGCGDCGALAESAEDWNRRTAQVAQTESIVMRAVLLNARAVINRWDSPLWRQEVHTAEFIDQLRKAVDAAEASMGAAPVAPSQPKQAGGDVLAECVAIAESELSNTSALMSQPPKSSAAWNIANRIRALAAHQASAHSEGDSNE